MHKTRVLLVNDDGIYASGLRALWKALKEVADVCVVAPQVGRSGAGLSITMYRPLHLEPVNLFPDTNAFCVSGTPADCVKLALAEVLKASPDFIFSGVNRGSNAGRNIFYSGTVGGVMEGVLHGIPGVALSCLDMEEPPFEEAAALAPRLLEGLLSHPLPEGTFLNVNFPLRGAGPTKGLRLARQGQSFWKEAPDRRRHPEGHDYYWLGGFHAGFHEEEGSDVRLLEEGYIPAVPIRIRELTDEGVLSSHEKLFDV